MANLSRKGAKLNDTAQMCADIPEISLEAKNGLNCLSCVKREFCREICAEVEAILPKKTTGRHKKEYLFDTNSLESLANARAFAIKFSREYKPDNDL